MKLSFNGSGTVEVSPCRNSCPLDKLVILELSDRGDPEKLFRIACDCCGCASKAGAIQETVEDWNRSQQ